MEKTEIQTDWISLYRHMQLARCIDGAEKDLVARGEAFFQLCGSGHEASATLATFLSEDDYLHCHYRDKALLLARGVPVVDFLHSVLCNAASHSAGRQMSPFLSVPSLHVLPMVVPVGNHALQAVGVAQAIRDLPSRPIVLCGMGDGTTQQGEVFEAIAEAVRSSLPVLFVIQDNKYAISTRTRGKTFFSLPEAAVHQFYGLDITWMDGSDVLACSRQFGAVVAQMRVRRAPAICVLQTERLTDHTNADDEKIYRGGAELSERHQADPIANLRRWLLEQGCSESDLSAIDHELVQQVEQAVDLALATPAPPTETGSKKLLRDSLTRADVEYRGEGGSVYTLSEAMRESLRAQLAGDARVTLYGQDIEDPKGDVFGTTRGLSTAFGGRVVNSPLSESTIVGASIGRAMAGGRPVAFLQFADFLPLAFNQIVSELATIHWRTNGGWQAPVLLLVSCGGYRPGLGPFHAQTFDSTLAHIPGLDVAVVSTAADAAGVINVALAGGRPTVLLYPKALLSDRSRMTSSDVHRQLVPVGRARISQQGTDLTLVGWGNTAPLTERVADALSTAGVSCDVMDLRWLSPWDKTAVSESVRKTRRLLVVHEDNLSGGFAGEILAAVAQEVGCQVAMRRVSRLDTFAPYHFGNQLEVFPSLKSALSAAADMLDLELSWVWPPAPKEDQLIVTAHGSSPSDQMVEVVSLDVKVGDVVRAGQIIASLEADKAVVDVSVPSDGTVEAVHLRVGDSTSVDSPLVTLHVTKARNRQPTTERPGQPLLRRRPQVAVSSLPVQCQGAVQTVVIAGICTCPGALRLSNDELGPRFPQLGGAAGIFERTGIEERFMADSSQNSVSMAVAAAQKLLADTHTPSEQLGLIICSTTTPVSIAPSLACSVLHQIAPGIEVPAYDVLAACSGYLYALSNAWDFLQTHPNAKVLVLTAETMRRMTDPDDPNTSPIFGDAATATLVTTAAIAPSYLAVLNQPVLGALGESGASLHVPLTAPHPPISMDGRHVFSEATRKMEAILKQACAQSGLTVDQLDLIVPHQANGRIIEAMRNRLGLPKGRVLDTIKHQGNTSSSSIALALESVFKSEIAQAQTIGLCAFGAGFTFAGAILKRVPPAVT